MSARTDTMNLVAFLMMPTSHHHGAWRHPASELNFDEAAYYCTTARILEDAKWDMLFMPDVLTVYGNYRGGFDTTVRYGGQGALSLDPVVIASCAAAVTSRIGLGVTQSASFIPPFQLARSLATLDLISGGRAAWNVVMSVSDAEAKNFGMEAIADRQGRYDRGDEVVDLVQRLWHSWDTDAIVRDKASGIFADPDKVHYTDFVGEWVSSRGPLGVPASKQGSPVIMQAGSSPRGKQFAARWGEVVFTLQHTVEDMRAYYASIKTATAEIGRNPDHCRILPAVQCIVGESEAEAREKLALLDSLIDPEVALATMSLHVGQDLSFADPHAPVEDIQVEQGSRGSFDVILQGNRYHPVFTADRAENKFADLVGFGRALGPLRRRVRRDLARSDLSHRHVVATVVRLLDLTSLRVGNEEYSRTNESFGLTTLLNSHARVRGSTIRLAFRGKSAHDFDVHVGDARLARIVRRCQDLPGQHLFGYRDEFGEVRHVGSSDVNAYLSEYAAPGLTAKTFRTWNATVRAAEGLSDAGARTDAPSKQVLNEVIDDVAAHLGNTRAVCRNSYIHPIVVQSYVEGTLLKRWQRPVPDRPNGLTAPERRTLRLLRSTHRGS